MNELENRGTKYYRNTKDNELGYQLIRHVGEDKYKDITTKESKPILKISNEELVASFTKLNPDGILFFHMIEIEGGDDILVTLNRRCDYENNNNVPYATCRQMIFDTFTNVTNRVPNYMYLGVSISIDTANEDIPYQSVLSCKNLLRTTAIYIYMDDCIEEILKMFNTKKYDNLLTSIYLKLRENKEPIFKGLTQSLYELLDLNKFIYDFRKAFDIDIMEFNIPTIFENDNKETAKLNIAARTYLEDYYKHEILNETLVEYSKIVDLKKISRNYKLVDFKNKIYLLVYDEGNNINRPYMRLEDRRDSVAMLKHSKTNI